MTKRVKTFDVEKWLAARLAAGKCACGECHCRAQLAFDYKVACRARQVAARTESTGDAR